MPADTDRFASWVQDLLSTMPNYSGAKVSGHSTKATPLSWMGKAGTDLDTLSLLGHHVLVGRSSALTYARDTQAAPVRKFEALLGDVRRGVFLPDSTRSGRFVPEASEGPAVPPEGVLFGADEIIAEARDASDHGSEPNFSFPPSPPLQLDDSLAPLPVPDFLRSPGQGPEFADEADWMQEREWYSCAAPESLETEPDDAPDCEPAAGLGPPASQEDESSSSSESSSSESVDERVQASGERADELVHRKLNECLMYKHRTTRTVHLLPAGASSGRFVCGREWNQATFKPVCGSVSLASLECKQCYKGRSLRDIGALNHALEVAKEGPGRRTQQIIAVATWAHPRRDQCSLEHGQLYGVRMV